MIYSSAEIGRAPQRAQHTRALRNRAKLELDATTIVAARVTGIWQHGMSLIVPYNMADEQPCAVHLSIYLKGSQHRVKATGNVVSCACAGMDGFRVAVRFTYMDDESATSVGQLLRNS